MKLNYRNRDDEGEPAEPFFNPKGLRMLVGLGFLLIVYGLIWAFQEHLPWWVTMFLYGW